VTLPALANLFAVCDENPLRADALQHKLQHSGEFAAVWRPAPGWVAAAAPLPGSVPDGAQVRGLGFAFAEGRDLVECQLEHAAQLAAGAPQRLASLPGDFGFIHFQADGSATVVRSCGGLVPFYLWQDGGRAAVATRLGDLVCYILHQPRLDPLVNAVWASGWGLFPDGRTFLEGVAALERGSFAQTGPHRAVSTQRYWSPRVEAVPLPNVARQQEHAERLRELLLGQLRRNLDPAGGNLLSMSGGVDSSALASLAAGVVGRPLSTFSMLPEPSEPFRHEMSYIRPLLGGLRIERSWMLRLRPETRVELLRAGPRTVFHVPHYALCALPTLLRQAPIRVLFGGEFADEVCGSSYTWPDWVASVGLLALLRGFPQPPSGTHRVLRWGKHRLLAALHRPVLPFPPRLPEYIRPELQEEYRAWRHRRRDAATRDHAPRRYLALRAEEDGFVAMNWEAATNLGVRRFFPFFNRDVIELAFECHPTELVGPGTKKLLRRALRQDVPQHNLERPDKGGWGSYVRAARLAWSEPLPEMLTTVVRREWYPRPPALVGGFEALGLTQLSLFAESLRARGTGLRLRPAAECRTLRAIETLEPTQQPTEARTERMPCPT